MHKTFRSVKDCDAQTVFVVDIYAANADAQVRKQNIGLDRCMNRAKDLIDYLREEPEEQAWATAGPKKDKSHDNRASAFGNSIKPQALLERFYSEGKILPGHLDERCLGYMKNLAPDIQCQALSEYANRRSKDTLNNPPAYFMSLLQSLEIAAQKTHSLQKKGLREGILAILAPAGRNLLRSLQDDGSIGQFELDSACISWLAKLPSHQQAQVLEQYANVKNRDQLRCNAAFFMGLLKQPLTDTLSEGFGSTAVNMTSQLPHGVLPDKPRPPRHPTQQALGTQIHSDMPRRLPTTSGPFPGVTRAPQSSPDQTDTHLQSRSPLCDPYPQPPPTLRFTPFRNYSDPQCQGRKRICIF
ncbi:hypothetical protein WJX79_000622 [Trebouxia sp. C0005]